MGLIEPLSDKVGKKHFEGVRYDDDCQDGSKQDPHFHSVGISTNHIGRDYTNPEYKCKWVNCIDKESFKPEPHIIRSADIEVTIFECRLFNQ